MVETRAELPFIGDQIVCISHDHGAVKGQSPHDGWTAVGLSQTLGPLRNTCGRRSIVNTITGKGLKEAMAGSPHDGWTAVGLSQTLGPLRNTCGRRSIVNTITGKGLKEAMAGAQVAIDLANSPPLLGEPNGCAADRANSLLYVRNR
jgi:hypothetical protein